MSSILDTIRSSFMLIIFTLGLGYLYISSDLNTRKLIAYTLYMIYTVWSTHGVWEATQSPKSILMWFLLCSIGFSFVIFIFVENKAISTYISYITIFVNLALLVAGIAFTITASNCENELKGVNDQEDDDKKSKSRFYILFGLIIFILLIEGYSTIAFVVFIIALTLNNHYQELHIGDIMYCL